MYLSASECFNDPLGKRTATMVATPPKSTLDASISAFGNARSTVGGSPLSIDELRKLLAFWQAANYLAVGMIYLRKNPLLKEPPKPEHIKQRLLGHWGSSPGISFLCTQLRRSSQFFIGVKY
jgi:xylulose-5-phosphate/fructose-6-phosphate phosphoketolase